VQARETQNGGDHIDLGRSQRSDVRHSA
jgi:hypothetical protein